jgi:hypothetical protein
VTSLVGDGLYVFVIRVDSVSDMSAPRPTPTAYRGVYCNRVVCGSDPPAVR